MVGGGEKSPLADIDGPGCIKHIWVTLAGTHDDYLRRVVMRFYWDGLADPSVECPIGDFFRMGHGMRKNFVSLPLQMSPQDGRGFNSWWQMPFKYKGVVEIENQGVDTVQIFYYVDYECYNSTAVVEDHAYFHVQWRWEAETDGWAYNKGLEWWSNYDAIESDPRYCNKSDEENYLIMEAEGNGIYCGAHLDIDCFKRNSPDWWGEGDDMVFIDGEAWPPSLKGPGTEDWFHCGHAPRQEYNAPYHGIILYSGWQVYQIRYDEARHWPYKGKQTVYRYYIEDPFRFRQSIRASIEHGNANMQSFDYASTAYYYLSDPKRGGPPILPVEHRLPRPDEEPYKP